MQYVKEHSDLAVPRVFAHAASENNPVAAAYKLTELLPLIVAMDAFGATGSIAASYPPSVVQFSTAQ